MSKPTKAQIAERDEYRAKLRDMLKPGDTVHTVLRSVSRSGMNRKIDVYTIEDGRPFRMTYWVAKACGITYDRKAEALSVSGCGMDMGFHVVYHLSAVLFPDGFGCTGEVGTVNGSTKRCPSNDHGNGDRDYTPHGTVYALPNKANAVEARPPVEHMHKDGGYALRQEWM